MFFTLIFSALQICFLPGFIAFILLFRKYSTLNNFLLPVISFGLSLIINYIIVSFLSYFHIYTKASLIILLIIECGILIILFSKKRVKSGLIDYKKATSELNNEIKVLIFQSKSDFLPIRLASLLLSVALLLFLVSTMIFNTGEIFSSWDGVFSWNRWAIDFYNNIFPPSTYHYPQLIPANWSVSYVLCGYPFQFIAKGMMPLFLIFPVYALIIMGILKRSQFLIYSVFFLFPGMRDLNWTDGFVDVPVAFFSIMVFICLSEVIKNEEDNGKYIILGTLFACGAAVTKQAGIFILLSYPFLVFSLKRIYSGFASKETLRFCFFYLAMIIFIVLPYYLYAEAAIKHGNSASEISYITNGIFQGATLPQRFRNACFLFSEVFRSRRFFVIILIPFLFSFKDRSLRIFNFTFFFPYFFIWALFFSYDLRNAAIIIPYFSLGIGYGTEIILNKLHKITKHEII